MKGKLRYLLIGAIATFVSAGCGSGSKSASSDSCITVTSSAATGAITAKVVAAKSGDTFGNGHKVWYLAAQSGALWATDADPATEESGLILPLNESARSSSDVGADVSATAPIYGDASPDSGDARAALACGSK